MHTYAHTLLAPLCALYAHVQGSKAPGLVLGDVLKLLSAQEQTLGGKRHGGGNRAGREGGSGSGRGRAGSAECLREELELLREAVAACKRGEQQQRC